MIIAIPKVIPRNVQFNGTTEVKCNIKSPAQLVKGPGKTGKKDPIIPRIANRKPTISKNISI